MLQAHSMTTGEFFERGAADEEFVAKAIEWAIGGKTEKSTKEENMYWHVDLWWWSPKKGRIGIDVKGPNKNNRLDSKYDSSIHWLELRNVVGAPGWLYGKAAYIAFRMQKQIVFVKREKLLDFALKMSYGKDIVYDPPKAFYVPYKRKKYGRDDLTIKAKTKDIEAIADFYIRF